MQSQFLQLWDGWPADLACQPSCLLLALVHWPLFLTQSEMNSVHPPPTHTIKRGTALLGDRHAARSAGHLTLARAAVCPYSGHHLQQSNLNVTFALPSLPPPKPQENPGILTAKHQLHYPTPAKIGAVLRVIPSGILLTPDPKRDKMAPFPHPQLCTQFSQQSNFSFSCFN